SLFLLVITCAVAQQLTTAEQVIAAHMDALGGYEKWKSVHTITSYSEYGEGAAKSIHRFDRRRPNLVRISTNYNMETGSFSYAEGFDGAAWEYSSKVPVRVTGEPARALKNASTFEKNYIDYSLKGFKAKLIGIEHILDRDFYYILLTAANGKTENYFFDVETLMPSISIGNAPFHGEGKSIETISISSDYRRVDGILFSFRYTQKNYQTGEILSDRRTLQMEVNNDFPDDWFSPPLSEPELKFQEIRKSALANNFSQVQSLYRDYTDIALRQLRQHWENRLNTLGYEMMSYERYEDAIVIFNFATKQFPNSANLFDSLGEALMKAGRLKESIASYKKSLELNPRNDAARKLIQKMESELKQ
ncbi:MAG: tetratricopeptide repeat protein, partial [Calditrichaeota bacterium]|nr:tetratricopeptide repeat protein [Calditrichota bacterium]